MWFIGVKGEQETSAPPPKKNPGSAPEVFGRAIVKISSCRVYTISSREIEQLGISFVSYGAGGRAHSSRGEIPGPRSLVTALPAAGGVYGILLKPLL